MRILLLVLALVWASSSFGQTEERDSIYVAKGFLGYRYYHQDERLNINHLPLLMHDNAEAYELITKSKNKHVLSSIISGAGGFLIGLQIANVIIGGDPNWSVVAAGGGLMVLSIPIFARSNKLSLQAVEIYNSRLSEVHGQRNPQLLFGMNQNGPGIRIVF